jgi:hypothetical protein
MEPNTTQELWRTEFDKQYTKELLRDLIRQVPALVRRYERKSPRRSTDTPEDRLHTAIMKLQEGARTWDPTRVDLGSFLLGVIASDLSGEMRRSKRFPQVSLNDRKLKLADHEASDLIRATRTTSHESTEGAWSIALAHLRELAASDKCVLALLDAYDQGAFEKRDVMRLLKWPPTTYTRVYQRLLRLADRLDEELRDVIVDALAN